MAERARAPQAYIGLPGIAGYGCKVKDLGLTLIRAGALFALIFGAFTALRMVIDRSWHDPMPLRDVLRTSDVTALTFRTCRYLFVASCALVLAGALAYITGIVVAVF